MKTILRCLATASTAIVLFLPALASAGPTLLVLPFEINQRYLDPLKRKANTTLCLKGLENVLNEEKPFSEVVSSYELKGLDGAGVTVLSKESVDKSRIWVRGRFNRDEPDIRRVLEVARREGADAAVLFSVYEGRTKWLVRVHLISTKSGKEYYRASKQVKSLRFTHAAGILKDVLHEYLKNEF